MDYSTLEIKKKKEFAKNGETSGGKKAICEFSKK